MEFLLEETFSKYVFLIYKLFMESHFKRAPSISRFFIQRVKKSSWKGTYVEGSLRYSSTKGNILFEDQKLFFVAIKNLKDLLFKFYSNSKNIIPKLSYFIEVVKYVIFLFGLK